MQVFAALLTAGLAFLGTLLNRLPEFDRRRTILRDLELLGRLPAELDDARQMLRGRIDADVRRLIERDRDDSRSGIGIGLALLFGVGCVLMLRQALDGGGWWWVGAVLTGIFAVVGLIESVPKVRRDVRGNRIRPATSTE